jgi:hypothetical protein
MRGLRSGGAHFASPSDGGWESSVTFTYSHWLIPRVPLVDEALQLGLWEGLAFAEKEEDEKDQEEEAQYAVFWIRV